MKSDDYFKYKKEVAKKETISIIKKHKHINSESIVLEIGSGYGYSAKELGSITNHVYALEPDSECANHAIKNGLVTDDKMLKCSLQDIDKSFYGKFDLAVSFLFCIKHNERAEYFKTLSNILKDDGIAIISGHDDNFFEKNKYGAYKNTAYICYDMEKNFKNVDMFTNNNVSLNKYSVVGYNPIHSIDIDAVGGIVNVFHSDSEI